MPQLVDLFSRSSAISGQPPPQYPSLRDPETAEAEEVPLLEAEVEEVHRHQRLEVQHHRELGRPRNPPPREQRPARRPPLFGNIGTWSLHKQNTEVLSRLSVGNLWLLL